MELPLDKRGYGPIFFDFHLYPIIPVGPVHHSGMVEPNQDEVIEFKWGKMKGRGGKKKDVQFYESFTFDGIDYTLYDSVYLFNENEVEPYIGVLIKIWENRDKTKRVKVLWFFRPSEISNYIGNEKFFENELLLACGEGVGLTNVNPLEAIAGKCNVVCTSKDSRNQQPLEKDLQMADFMFYRTFDVGCHIISDKIGEKIASTDVKFIFNKMHSEDYSGVQKLDSNEKGIVEKALDIVEPNEKHVDEINLSIMNSCLGEEMLCTNGVLLGEVAKPTHKDGKSGENFILRSIIEDNATTMQSLDIERALSRQTSTSNLDVESVKHGHESTFNNKTSCKSKEDLVGSSNNNSNRVLVDQGTVEEKTKSSKDWNLRDDMNNDKDIVIVQASKHERDVKKNWDAHKNKGTQEVNRMAQNAEVVRASKHERDPQRDDKGLYKKPKLDEKLTKLANDKLSKPSLKQALNKGIEAISEARRPEVDKSKWFKLPWEERLRIGHEQGRLVLLQNLDPTYSSTEVEDIIQKVFKLTCSAKMIQQTAFPSPPYGQAFVIFTTRQAAEMVVKKLDEGCLLLPNGSVLVGSIATPCFPAKRSTFYGHLVINKQRHQMQREMKEAVSTSHCSQPNTIEYDMAMEWCVRQKRSDQEWKTLRKLQGKELRNLKAALKSK